MLAQRRRLWANISPALGQRFVFDSLHYRNRWTEAHTLMGHRDIEDAQTQTEQTN